MQLKRYYFYTQFSILFYQIHTITAMIGYNIRSAEENEFPFIVSIMKTRGFIRSQVETFHKCTASLITRQDVLTADHCLTTTFTEGFKVMVGSPDLAQSIEFYPIYSMAYEHWLIYRRRRLTNEYHDLALIKINGNVNETIEIATLGNIETHYLYGLDVDTAGWGKLRNNSIPRFLQTAPLKVMTKTDCEERVTRYTGEPYRIDNKHFCSIGNPYTVLNRGDSGGPLLYFGTIVGINSAVCPNVDNLIRPYQINIHLNMRQYQDFLNDIKTNFAMNF